jgi:hypothetical protein
VLGSAGAQQVNQDAACELSPCAATKHLVCLKHSSSTWSFIRAMHVHFHGNISLISLVALHFCRFRPWYTDTERYVRASDTGEDELLTGYETPDSAKANMILQDPLAHVTRALLDISAEQKTDEPDNGTNVLIEPKLHAADSSEMCNSEPASARHNAREATTVIVEENNGGQHTPAPKLCLEPRCC